MRKRLALDEKYNVDPPYTGRESNDTHFSVPNGDSDDLLKLRKGYHRR